MRKSLIITVVIALLCLCGCKAAVTVPESAEPTKASEMLLTTTAAEESTDMKSAFAERNRPDLRGLFLRSPIQINRLHEPQSRKALRRRGTSLHLNGKLSLKSKTLFSREKMSAIRALQGKRHPPVVKSGETLYVEGEIRPSRQRSGRNTRLSSQPVLPERRP